MLTLLHPHPPGRLSYPHRTPRCPTPSLLAVLPPLHPSPPRPSCLPPAQCLSPPVRLRAPPSPAPGEPWGSHRPPSRIRHDPGPRAARPHSPSRVCDGTHARGAKIQRGCQSFTPGLLSPPVSSAAQTPRLGWRPGCTARVTCACAGPSAGSLPHTSAARSATPRRAATRAWASGPQAAPWGPTAEAQGRCSIAGSAMPPPPPPATAPLPSSQSLGVSESRLLGPPGNRSQFACAQRSNFQAANREKV